MGDVEIMIVLLGFNPNMIDNSSQRVDLVNKDKIIIIKQEELPSSLKEQESSQE